MTTTRYISPCKNLCTLLSSLVRLPPKTWPRLSQFFLLLHWHGFLFRFVYLFLVCSEILPLVSSPAKPSKHLPWFNLQNLQKRLRDLVSILFLPVLSYFPVDDFQRKHQFFIPTSCCSSKTSHFRLPSFWYMYSINHIFKVHSTYSIYTSFTYPNTDTRSRAL